MNSLIERVNSMNQNIEVINPHLWAVNYHHLQYIKDIDYLCGDPDAMDKEVSIKNDGVIVLNKIHEMYPTLKQFMPKIMANTDAELLRKSHYMKDKDRDDYDRVYKFCLDAEAKRRLVKKQYNEQPKEIPIIKKIVNLIGFNSKERR